MTENIVQLFVGDPIGEPSERAFIARLLRDLTRVGQPAVLYANFFPSTRQQRQIDLLVRTPTRTTHIEIKSLNPHYPLRGAPNGPWVQLLPDGTERVLESNCGRQALLGTFAISDAMRDMSRRGDASSAAEEFKKHIDTIVAMWEDIPAGSTFQTPPFVSVIGYGFLLDRLCTSGPCVAWSDDEWDTFARTHGLFQPDPESHAQRFMRRSLESITDYRQRARASFADGLPGLVDVGADDVEANPVGFDDIDRAVASGAVVGLLGVSGAGKTFFARHLAVRHCDRGRLVVWLRGGEYEQGRFRELVARAMGPYSSRRWAELMRPAAGAGVGITIVLDGINECPPDLVSELVQQLESFVLRHPAGILLTAATADEVPGILDARLMWLRTPDEAHRSAILKQYGAVLGERVSAQLKTPFELSIAAQCEGQLGENATVTELHDAFVRRFAGNEQMRGGLRVIAAELHARLRSSLPLLDVTGRLGVTAVALSAAQVDDVLGCRLLEIERHRVRFRHELVAAFLAAEDLVRSANSGRELGRALTSPANRGLASTALAIERNMDRLGDALVELADAPLIAAAVRGAYGAEATERMTEKVRGAMRQASAATDPDEVTFEGTEFMRSRWRTVRPLTKGETALLAAAGSCLRDGLFVEQVRELLDRSDELCRRQVALLRQIGSTTAVSTIVAATYGMTAARDEHALPASHVVAASERAAMATPSPHTKRSRTLAEEFASTTDVRSWGQLHTALLSIDPHNTRDQALFASLLRRIWKAGGYHLRLNALRIAMYLGVSKEPHRSEILDVVRSFETDNWALQSSIVEVLARFGEIHTDVTVQDLQTHIRAVIAQPHDVDYCSAARATVSNQFEDEDIVGPYCEAVDGLTRHEQVRLFTMASHPELLDSMHLAWTLERLHDLVPTGDVVLDADVQTMYRRFLDGPTVNSVIPTESAAACLAAIRGWAKFDSVLPPPPPNPTPDQAAWRLVAALLLRYQRDDAVVDAETTWRELIADPRTAIEVLALIDGATTWEHRPAVLTQLFADYPDQCRQLYEWALDNPTLSAAKDGYVRLIGNQFIIRALGAVGDARTVERLRVQDRKSVV